MMKQELEKYLEQFKGIDWFHAVGEPSGTYAVVKNGWKGAARKANQLKWENWKLRNRNELTCWLTVNAPNKDLLWNDLTAKWKQNLAATWERAAMSVPEEHRETVMADTRWDTLTFFMELEYYEVFPMRSYRMLAEAYLNGRFPCGWDGKYPMGKLIVY